MLNNFWNPWVLPLRLHVEVRQFFIRDLREEGVLRVDWIPGTENESDILTKNTTGQVFQKHVSRLEE